MYLRCNGLRSGLPTSAAGMVRTTSTPTMAKHHTAAAVLPGFTCNSVPSRSAAVKDTYR
jgi:hypothetical protein